MSAAAAQLTLPVSVGEALDKLTILDIKCRRISDERKADCKREYDTLFADLSGYVAKWSWHYDILLDINTALWDLQDQFHGKDVDEITVGRLCSKILIENDRRFRVKAKINHCAGSVLREQKGYAKKRAFFYGHLGLGDMFWLVGAVRYLATCFEEVVVVCKQKYLSNVIPLYEDDPTIKFFPVEDDIYPFQQVARPQLEEQGFKVFACGYHGEKPQIYEFPYCFYDDLKIPREYRQKYFYISPKVESRLLAESVRAAGGSRYIVVHQQAQFKRMPIWDFVSAHSDLPVYDVNENHYPVGHKYYDAAQLVVNTPLWSLKDLLEGAEEIHLLESSVYCMASHLDLSRVKDKVCYDAFQESNVRIGVFRTGVLP